MGLKIPYLQKFRGSIEIMSTLISSVEQLQLQAVDFLVKYFCHL